jgi:DNA-nicking Smr family endonuclease
MTLSDEDKALFNDTMKTVKPLQNITKREPKPPVVAKFVRRKPDLIETTKPDYYLSNHYTETVSPSCTLAYCSNELPRKRLRELKNGEIRWEARLDLHGLRPDAAQNALCDFLEKPVPNITFPHCNKTIKSTYEKHQRLYL